MKKTLFIIIVMFLSTLITSGQDTLSSSKKIQYYHAIDAGIEIGCFKGFSQYSTYPFGVTIHETHAIQFNPHSIFGLDVGFEYANLDLYDMYTLSACLHFRYIILKNRKWSPFVMCNLGAGGGFEGLKSKRPDYGLQNCNSVFVMKSALYLGIDHAYRSQKSLFFAVGYELDWGCFVFRIGTRL